MAGAVLLVRVRETTHEPRHRHGALALCGNAVASVNFYVDWVIWIKNATKQIVMVSGRYQ